MSFNYESEKQNPSVNSLLMKSKQKTIASQLRAEANYKPLKDPFNDNKEQKCILPVLILY